MKKFIISVFAILFYSILTGQITEVVTGLNGPTVLVLNGNELYFAEYTTKSIFKIDITESSPTPELVFTAPVVISGFAISGNELYFSQFELNKISKIDMTENNPVSVDVITGQSTPDYILIEGNMLYFSQKDAQKVARFDITDPNPVAEVVATSNVNFRPRSMVLDGNILYMSQSVSDRVSKVDISSGVTQPVDVATRIGGAAGLAVVGTDLYICQAGDNIISKKDLLDNNPNPPAFITDLQSPQDIAIKNTTMYFSEYRANKISRVELTLAVNDFDKVDNIELYPNPSSDFMKVSNLLEASDYIIYSINGSEVGKGTLKPNDQINITALANGTYFLRMDNGTAVKFIKD